MWSQSGVSHAGVEHVRVVPSMIVATACTRPKAQRALVVWPSVSKASPKMLTMVPPFVGPPRGESPRGITLVMKPQRKVVRPTLIFYGLNFCNARASATKSTAPFNSGCDWLVAAHALSNSIMPPPPLSATQARLSQCSMAHDADSRTAAARPLLASASALRANPVLWLQGLINVSEWTAQLASLPHSGSASEVGISPRQRCAVVGSSGSMLARHDGSLVDSHDHIIRINSAPVEGFEAHVGNRTTIELAWSADHIMRFARRPPSQRAALGMLAPTTRPQVARVFAALANRSSSAPRLVLLGDAVYNSAMNHLCNATRDGAAWYRNRSTSIRPSTGLQAVLFARRACHSVSLFGLQAAVPPCEPFHYHQPQREANAGCPSAVPTPTVRAAAERMYDNPWDWHWFALEHELYRSWEREAVDGSLVIYS